MRLPELIAERLRRALVRLSPDGSVSQPAVGIEAPRFEEAILWHRQRDKALTKEAWAAQETRLRQHSFTVANVAQLDLVHDVWKAIDKAVADGTTLADFKQEVGDRLKAAWAGSVANPEDRLDNIFRTNVQLAYGAGRWSQAVDAIESHPFWQLDVTLDGRTTKTCRRVAGIVLRHDHPWWRTNVPPRHFRCRSTIRSRTARAANRILLERTQAGLPNEPGSEASQDGFGAEPAFSSPWAPNRTKYPAALLAAADGKGAFGPPPAPPGGGGGPPGGGDEDDPVERLSPGRAARDWRLVKRGTDAFERERVRRALAQLFPEGTPSRRELERFGSDLPDGWKLEFGSAKVSGAGAKVRFLLTGPGVLAGIDRSFRREDGELRVHHDYFELPEEAQGSGVGSAVLRGMFREYARLGVRQVDLTAAWVGRYTWASMGFRFDLVDEKDIAGKFVRYLAARSITLDIEVASDLARSPWLLAHYVSPGGDRLGKAFLLDDRYVDGWQGIMRLEPGDPGYERMRRKLGL